MANGLPEGASLVECYRYRFLFTSDVSIARVDIFFRKNRYLVQGRMHVMGTELRLDSMMMTRLRHGA